MRPLLASVCLVALLTVAPAAARPSAAGDLVVGFTEGSSASARASALAAAGATVTRSLPQIDAVVVTAPPSALADLRSSAAVEYAHADASTHGLAATDPGYLGDAWAYDGTTTGLDGVWPVWTGDTGTVIAVLDTGIDATHPDFAGKLAAGYDFINEDTDPDDDNGHGTAVAGAAAALDDGASGIGACPGCSILPVKIFDASGSTTSSAIARGILWAVDQGADVLNLSYGSAVEDPAEKDAVAYAHAHGVIVVASAGNAGTDGAEYPAKLPGVIGVGAIDDAQSPVELAAWSNYGNGIDLVAPGRVGVSDDGGGIAEWAGTSFAAPLVAGTAALLLSSELDPSPSAVAAALDAGTRTVEGAPFDGLGVGTAYPLFDGFLAFASLAPVSPPALVTPFVTTYGAARVGQTLWARTGTWTPVATSFSYQWRRCDAIGAACTDIPGATGQSFELTAADLGATLRVLVTAGNAAGTSTGVSLPTPAVQAASNAPVPTGPPTLSGTTATGGTLTVSAGTWTGSPSFTYAWQRCDAAGFSCATQASTGTTYVVGSADLGKRVRAVVTATNADGTEVADAFSAVVTATATTAATAAAKTDLATTLSASTTRPGLGREVTLTATVTGKAGGITATRVTLTLLLPEALLAQRTIASKGLCLGFGNRIDCELGPLAPGATATVTVTASVHAEGTLAVKASTRSEPADGAAADDAPTLTLVVGGAASGGKARQARATLAGRAVVGSTLRVVTGTRAATARTTVAWQACRGSSCTTLKGRRAPTLKLTRAHVGRRLRAVVTTGGVRTTTPLSAVVRRA
jgi:subtilisin family serine protease